MGVVVFINGRASLRCAVDSTTAWLNGESGFFLPDGAGLLSVVCIGFSGWLVELRWRRIVCDATAIGFQPVRPGFGAA